MPTYILASHPNQWASRQKQFHQFGIINDRKMGRIVDGIMLKPTRKKKSKSSSSSTVSSTAPHLTSRWQSQDVNRATTNTLKIKVRPLREFTSGYPPHGVVSQL